jgi:hypothetical protein
MSKERYVGMFVTNVDTLVPLPPGTDVGCTCPCGVDARIPIDPPHKNLPHPCGHPEHWTVVVRTDEPTQ